jgi:hypothetical protein
VGSEVPEGGDNEVTVVPDETLGEQDPLLAKLLTAATAGAAPAGPASKRQPIRIVLAPDGRLHILPEGAVRLDFKKPWSDGTSSVDLAPLALIARLAALVPPPRRHLTRYCCVLSSHASLRSQVVPQTEAEAPATEKPEKPARTSKYIPWAELLHRTFGFEIGTDRRETRVSDPAGRGLVCVQVPGFVCLGASPRSRPARSENRASARSSPRGPFA